MGGNFPSRAEIVAPICASGPMMRCIGRLESESSPPMRVVNGWPARMPDNMRIVEPELPASSWLEYSLKPYRPWPCTVTSRPSSLISMPSERKQPSVE